MPHAMLLIAATLMLGALALPDLEIAWIVTPQVCDPSSVDQQRLFHNTLRAGLFASSTAASCDHSIRALQTPVGPLSILSFDIQVQHTFLFVESWILFVS